MLLKNAQIYRLAPGALAGGGALLREAFNRHPLMPCSGLALQSRGWVPPAEGLASLVFEASADLLWVAMGTETKLLPAAVVNQQALQRAERWAQTMGYAPSRKVMREIKEQVTAELLPKAFAQRRHLHALIDLRDRWLVVNSPSAHRAEDLLEQMRNNLGELPVTRLETEISPQGAMTQWLAAGKAPPPFALDSESELKSTSEEHATVRYLRHDLSGKDIRDHISGGKLATRVGLVWRERLGLVLQEPFALRRLHFLELKDEPREADADAAAQLQADLLITGAILRLLLADLVQALGGEK